MQPQVIVAAGAALAAVWYFFFRKPGAAPGPDGAVAPGPTDVSTLWTDGLIWTDGGGGGGGGRGGGGGGNGGSGSGSGSGSGTGGGGGGGGGGQQFGQQEKPDLTGGAQDPLRAAALRRRRDALARSGALTFRQTETARRLAGIKASGRSPVAELQTGLRGRSVKNPPVGDAIEKLVRSDLPPSTDAGAWAAYAATHPAALKAMAIWEATVAAPELAGVHFPAWTSLTHGEQAYLVGEAEKGPRRETAAISFSVLGRRVSKPAGVDYQFFGKQTAPVLRHTFARGAVTTDRPGFTAVHAEVAMSDLIRRMEHAWYSEQPAEYRAWMIDNWLWEVYPKMAAHVPNAPRLWREVPPEFKGAFRDVVRSAVERRTAPRYEEFQGAFGQLALGGYVPGAGGAAQQAAGAAEAARDAAGGAVDKARGVAAGARGKIGL